MENLLNFFGGTKAAVEGIVKIVVVAVILYLAYKLYKKFQLRNAGKAYGVNKGNLDPSQNYENLAKGVHDAVGGWIIFQSGDDIENMAKQLLFLNDDELKQVNNLYLKLYGNSEQNLQDAFSGAVCVFCSSRELLLERLTKLGIN